MTMKLTYYDNKEEHGEVYNWRYIFSLYKKLKVPAEFYDPTKTPIDKIHIADIISIRARGKTTAWLLVALLCHCEYGTQIAYIRQREDMLAPVNARELFNVINTYQDGRYIKQITHGEYNFIFVKDRRAYLGWLSEETGEIEKKTTEPWLYMLSVDRNYLYKSSLNLPRGNLIIYDEFISKEYRPNEFIQFNDLLSTIIRKRITPVVIMLANNIDVTSPYFREQEISKDVKKLKLGESKICYTTKSMPVYVEIDKPNKTARHTNIINRLFFGYSNPRLTSITGECDAWVFDNYQHITHEDDEELLYNHLYLSVGDDLLNVEFLNQPTLGIVCHVHPATCTYKDSIILTCGDITKPQEQYRTGIAKPAAALWKMYSANKIYFADNETGTLFDQYIDMCKVSHR